MRKLLLTPLALCLVAAAGIAQENNQQAPVKIPCYSEEHFREQALKHPEMLIERENYEKQLQEIIANNNDMSAKSASVNKVIPVVFHIVHLGGVDNISKAQCLDQIRILNEDYQRLNADTTNTPAPFKALAGSANVEFRMAQKDAQGNCTEGITRHYNTMTNGPLYRDDLKQVIDITQQWPRNKYLNIWVVDAIYSGGTGGGTILGYAQFPGTGQAFSDGVCIRHDEIGSIGTAATSPFGNGKGRTATHEVGHWLNLRHIWGDATCGSDLVSDTPTHQAANSGCPSFPHNANSSCGTGANGEMYTDYMDYSNGSCLNMFSAGQCTRMNNCLNSPSSGRNNLSTAANLAATGTDGSTNVCAPTPDYAPWGYKYVCRNGNVTFTDRSYNGIEISRQWSFPGGTTTGSLSDSIIVVNYATPGTYDVSLTVSNSNGSNTETRTGKIIVLQDTSSSILSVSEDFENTASVNNKWIVLNNDNGDGMNEGWQVTNSTSFTGSQCFMYHNFGHYGAQVDEFVSPTYNFTNLSAPVLKFKLHFATTDAANNDQLRVLVSSNCGTTWTQRYVKTANNTTNPLNTTTDVYGTDYTPAVGSAEWREETVNIPNLTGKPNSRIKFEFTSGYGNNIFIDDINITGTPTDVAKINSENLNFTVAPNPVVNESQLSFNMTNGTNVSIKVYDVLGKEVMMLYNGYMPSGEQKFTIRKGSLSSGVYFVNINMDGSSNMQKFVIN